MSISPYVKWLSGSLCYNNASCKYWTWIEDYNGWDQTCHLKDANPGLTYLEGVISGGKNCMAPTGKDSEPYQHFFSTFKSNKIHCKHAPNAIVLPSTCTATFDSKMSM